MKTAQVIDSGVVLVTLALLNVDFEKYSWVPVTILKTLINSLFKLIKHGNCEKLNKSKNENKMAALGEK